MFSLANKLTRKSAIFLSVLDSEMSLSIKAVLLFVLTALLARKRLIGLMRLSRL